MASQQKNTSVLDDDASVGSIEINLKAVDQMMAEGIGSMSLHDRNAIYEEIHGVSNMAIEETPAMIQSSLQLFEDELERTDRASRSTYDAILNQPGNSYSKNLIRGDEFRLRFLRFVLFDSKLAVDRMMAFLEVIHTLYGLEALKKFDTSIEFFIDTKDVQTALRAGYIQLLPFRDRSGRKIIVFVLDSLRLESTVRIKIVLYITYVAGVDLETQRNGCILLFWPGVKDLNRTPNTRHRSMVSKLINSVPTRFACFHICFPNTGFYRIARAMLTLAVSQLSSNRVARVIFHSGEQTEMLYELMGYGIPVGLIPVTGTGTLKTKTFVQWIKARKSLVANKTNGKKGHRLECPGLNDVIFRSAGKSCMLNPGNVFFRGMFENYHEEHVNAGQTEKKNLVWKIVQEVESRGGKFLTWDKRGWWIVLEDRIEIRSKVAISFRDYNKQQRAIANERVSKSSTFAFERQDGKRRKRGNIAEYSSDENYQNCDNYFPGGCFS